MGMSSEGHLKVEVELVRCMGKNVETGISYVLKNIPRRDLIERMSETRVWR